MGIHLCSFPAGPSVAPHEGIIAYVAPNDEACPNMCIYQLSSQPFPSVPDLFITNMGFILPFGPHQGMEEQHQATSIILFDRYWKQWSKTWGNLPCSASVTSHGFTSWTQVLSHLKEWDAGNPRLAIPGTLGRVYKSQTLVEKLS